MEMISQLGATPLASFGTVEPRCRERNRRWRKSHLNKDLTASYSLSTTILNLFIDWMLTGGCSPQSFFGIQKSAVRAVYMSEPPTFLIHFGVLTRNNKSASFE